MKRILNKSISLFSAFFMLLSLSAIAQGSGSVVVRGKVIDKKDKQPVIGAAVTVIDKDRRTITGASTDIEGNYSVRVSNPAYQIAVSYLGYKSATPVTVGDKTVINFQLEPSSTALNEVVITSKAQSDNGTGLNIDKRNLTTSVASISAKDLEEMQAASIDQALQGRLPGVDIAATSGDPGAGMQIRIRGTSSINGATDPLIVVDGMPYDTSVPDDFNFATSDVNNYAQLLNIAPSDIKDISVLKDAAATAVWGSRASNGVLIINTKRGSIGKPVISYTFKGSLSKQPEALPLLNGNQYSTLILEEYFNAGKQFATSEFAKEFQYDPNDPANYYNFSQNTNWIDAVTQVGYLGDNNVSISGGGEKAKYFASLGYFGQTGTTVGTDLKRLTARINLDYTVSDRIRFRSDISYTHIDNNQLYNSGIRGVAYTKMPNQSIYEYDEYGNNTGNYFSPAATAQGYAYFDAKGALKGTYNPVAMAREGINRQLGDRVVPHFNLQYDILPKILTASSDVQFDINNSKANTFLPQIATGRPIVESSVNRASDADADQFTVASKTNLIFTPNIGASQTLQGLFSVQTNDYRYVSQLDMATNTASSQLQDPSIDSRTQSSALTLSSYQSQRRSIGALVSAQYGLLDRYLVNVGLRADGDSRFGPGNRYGLFPSISTRYRLSSEPFMRKLNLKFLDDFSLRASYGQSGNAPRKDYTYFNVYQTYGYSYLNETGIRSTNIELTDLRWETVIGKNIGMNLVLYKNRINVDLDIYRNTTKDLFYNGLRVATYNGFQGVDMNVGTMDNQGWELNVALNPVKNKNWRVDFNFNIAQNQNMIREISPLYPTENSAKITENGKYKEYLQINNPFGSFYGFKYSGVYSNLDETIARDKNGDAIIGPDGQQVYMRFNYPLTNYVFQPGDAKYEDINHDGTIDYKDIIYLGDSNPTFTGGFGPTITYKGNLKLSAFFSFRTGYELINGTRMSTTNMSGYDNQSTAVLRRWKKEGDVTDIPRALYGTGYNWLGSSRYVEDGSFLRLRSLTVRYNFNKRLSNKLGMKNFSIYGTGENIFTLTNYTGQDPEVTTKINGPFTVAIDNSMTPPTKTVTVGVSAQF